MLLIDALRSWQEVLGFMNFLNKRKKSALELLIADQSRSMENWPVQIFD